jgi:hypothetical protein
MVNWLYLVIPQTNEGKLGGFRKFIQRDTNLYFMKKFQFQRLLSQSKPSIEIQNSISESSIDRWIDVGSIQNAIFCSNDPTLSSIDWTCDKGSFTFFF